MPTDYKAYAEELEKERDELKDDVEEIERDLRGAHEEIRDLETALGELQGELDQEQNRSVGLEDVARLAERLYYAPSPDTVLGESEQMAVLQAVLSCREAGIL